MRLATNHAQQRSKERLGFSKSTTERMADKALREGLRAADTSGRLRRHLDGMGMAHGTTPVIYGEHIYVFSSDRALITVLYLPVSLRLAAQKAKARRGEAVSTVVEGGA